jgi:hypothetical protein
MRCSASTPVSPACWLCILPSRPMTAFGPDDRAKVSALTSGADLRSTGPTTLSSQVAPPCQHEELALALSGRCPDPLAWDTVGWARAGLAARAARTGEELGAATGAQARTAGLRGCASPLLASRPRSASHTVRPRCWPWSPRARRTDRSARRCSSSQDRQRPRLTNPGQAGSHWSRRGSRDRPPARLGQAMIRWPWAALLPHPVLRRQIWEGDPRPSRS